MEVDEGENKEKMENQKEHAGESLRESKKEERKKRNSHMHEQVDVTDTCTGLSKRCRVFIYVDYTCSPPCPFILARPSSVKV
jgi:hypothetical protein